jgi:hypothetical protein
MKIARALGAGEAGPKIDNAHIEQAPSNAQDKEKTSRTSWRDWLPIHPAAELFPLMSKTQLRELAADIKRNGLRLQLAVIGCPDGKPTLLEGRNRLDAMELVGLKIVIADIAVRVDYPGFDPYAYVISANFHRRHLTAEQKRELIAKLIKATPEKSDRQIAAMLGVSHHTVGMVRTEMERRGQIAHVETHTDSKGRKQPSRKRRARKKSTKPKPRNDIGADSRVEAERLRVRVEELQAQVRQRDFKITGLESEIEELRGKLATGIGGDMSISEFQAAHKQWEEAFETQRGIIARLENENAKLRAGAAAPPADDELDIPERLKRSAS